MRFESETQGNFEGRVYRPDKEFFFMGNMNVNPSDSEAIQYRIKRRLDENPSERVVLRPVFPNLERNAAILMAELCRVGIDPVIAFKIGMFFNDMGIIPERGLKSTFQFERYVKAQRKNVIETSAIFTKSIGPFDGIDPETGEVSPMEETRDLVMDVKKVEKSKEKVRYLRQPTIEDISPLLIKQVEEYFENYDRMAREFTSGRKGGDHTVQLLTLAALTQLSRLVTENPEYVGRIVILPTAISAEEAKLSHANSKELNKVIVASTAFRNGTEFSHGVTRALTIENIDVYVAFMKASLARDLMDRHIALNGILRTENDPRWIQYLSTYGNDVHLVLCPHDFQDLGKFFVEGYTETDVVIDPLFKGFIRNFGNVDVTSMTMEEIDLMMEQYVVKTYGVDKSQEFWRRFVVKAMILQGILSDMKVLSKRGISYGAFYAFAEAKLAKLEAVGFFDVVYQKLVPPKFSKREFFFVEQVAIHLLKEETGEDAMITERKSAVYENIRTPKFLQMMMPKEGKELEYLALADLWREGSIEAAMRYEKLIQEVE